MFQKLVKNIKSWFTKPVTQSRDELVDELLQTYKCVLLVTESESKVFVADEDSALNLMIYLCFSGYYHSMYKEILAKFPGVEDRFAKEILKLTEEKTPVLNTEEVVDLDEPFISPLMSGSST